MTTEVRRREQDYAITVDDRHAGRALFQLRDDAVVLTHTEVDPAFEGQGVGSALAKGALDDVRAQGKRVVPLCPFIARYIENHPEYADLVAAA
ncbi:MAG: GCN5-related N-acetyltransferase [Frankiales bacterium]|nr:GCN5-related N-acetyltransferase [Frankiales bacterium]